MTLDLNQLGKQLADALEKETPDSLNDYLKKKRQDTYVVTGTFHGSIVFANSEGDARRAFHNEYNGESIIDVLKKGKDYRWFNA